MDRPPSRVIQEVVELGQKHEYATFLKVPCAGQGVWQDQVDSRSGLESKTWHPLSQRAAYMSISHQHADSVNDTWGVGVTSRTLCSEGGQHCAIVDLVLLDLRLRELRHLVALGNEECGTSFPEDIWEATGLVPLVDAPPVFQSPPHMSMVTEREAMRPRLWQDPRPSRPRAARGLPDGTFSCRLEATHTAGITISSSAKGKPNEREAEAEGRAKGQATIGIAGMDPACKI